MKVSEGAAYGAAMQALWCWRQREGENVAISDITDELVQLNPTEQVEPIARNVSVYREMQTLQDGMSIALRKLFLKHHRWVLRSVL